MTYKPLIYVHCGGWLGEHVDYLDNFDGDIHADRCLQASTYRLIRDTASHEDVQADIENAKLGITSYNGLVNDSRLGRFLEASYQVHAIDYRSANGGRNADRECEGRMNEQVEDIQY